MDALFGEIVLPSKENRSFFCNFTAKVLGFSETATNFAIRYKPEFTTQLFF